MVDKMPQKLIPTNRPTLNQMDLLSTVFRQRISFPLSLLMILKAKS